MKKILLVCTVLLSLTACHTEPKQKLPVVPVTNTNTDFSNFYVTPEVYAIVASRVTNKMLDGTRSLYRKKELKPTIFITDVQDVNENLPDGFHYARKVTEDILEGARDFSVVDSFSDAQYQLDIVVSATPNPNMNSPIITYELRLFDNNGEFINSWNDNIKQIQNDDESWW